MINIWFTNSARRITCTFLTKVIAI